MKRMSLATAFDPVNRVVDASGTAGFNPHLVIAIFDTTGPGRPCLYDFTTEGLGFVSVSGSLMTLEVDTTGLSSLDVLQIYWDDGSSLAQGSTNPTSGNSGTLTLSGSPTQLSNFALVNGVTLKAKRTNVDSIFVNVGGVASTSNYFLEPGDTVSLGVPNLSLIHVLAAVSGDVLSYIAN